MKTLAQATLDYILFLNFSEEDEVDPQLALQRLESLDLELKEASSEEKEALAAAAKETLAFLLREPDEYGYTPRKLVSPEERELLTSISDGTFFHETVEEDE